MKIFKRKQKKISYSIYYTQNEVPMTHSVETMEDLMVVISELLWEGSKIWSIREIQEKPFAIHAWSDDKVHNFIKGLNEEAELVVETMRAIFNGMEEDNE